MDFVKISDGQRAEFERDGFLIVRNALQGDRLKAVRDAADRIAGPFLGKPIIPSKPEYNHMDWRPGLLREKALLDLVTNSPTVPLVVQLLTPNIHLHSTTIIYKKPSDPNAPAFRRGWHRDIRIPKDLGHLELPRVGIKICYCLTDFHEPASGMTLLTRGTHTRKTPLVVPKGEVDPKGVELCDLQLNAGDAFLFENRLYHTATPNRSNRTSKVLMYGYAYRWMQQEVELGDPDPRIAQSDPVLWQMLGGYRDIDTVPWALTDWCQRNGAMPPPVPWTVEDDA